MGTISATLLVWLAPLIDYVATHHRALAMCAVVLPASFAVRVATSVRDAALSLVAGRGAGPLTPSSTSDAAHTAKVARVVAAVRARLARPAAARRRKMCTARAPWQNLSTRFADYKADSDCIWVGELRAIVALDAAATSCGSSRLSTSARRRAGSSRTALCSQTRSRSTRWVS